MDHPTSRVLSVLELLQARPKLSSGELAARLEVDQRTVRRYIHLLQDLGVPVESSAGRYGGYRLRPGYKLPPMMFTEDEALALVFGLTVARRTGVGEATSTEGALAKIDRVLPDRLRGKVQAVQGALSFTPVRGLHQPADAALLLAVSTAAQESRRIWLRYQGLDVPATEREIDPYGVVHHRGRWYVVGWCHLRADVRVFRLDRVADHAPRTATFARPLAFDAADYVIQSLARVPWGWPIEVLLHLPLAEARYRLEPDLGTLEAARGGTLLRTQADNLRWMARLLVQLDCPFRIRRPELRQAVRDLSREIVANL